MRISSRSSVMRKIQVPDASPYSCRDAAKVVNRHQLPARIIWIMMVTALATFGILVAGYKLLF